MSKQCAKLSSQLNLTIVSIRLMSKDDVDQLHEEIQNLRQTSGLTDLEFNRCLLECDLNPEEFADKKQKVGKLTPTLMIKTLDYNNFQSIFAGATSAWGWMTHYFKSNLFKHAFVTTDMSVPPAKLISSGPYDFNLRIVQFKNFLFKDICQKLGIQTLQYNGKEFGEKEINRGPFAPFTAKINIDLYAALMGHSAVTNLINTMVTEEGIRSNPLANPGIFDAFSALFLLNNFDACIAGTNDVKHGDLEKLVKIDPNLKGSLQNVNYLFEPEGTEPDNWTAHTIETSGAEKYSSSLGKFILAQIPMLDSFGNPIPGRFMSEQDAFVVSAILQDLEYEYFLEHLDDPIKSKVSLRNGGKEALHILLTEGTHLKSFNRHRRRLAPIIKFLYEGEQNKHYSIREATRLAQNAKQSVTLLDVEGVLAFELNKLYAPAYLEYTTTGQDALGRDSQNVVRAINNGKTYRVTDGIKLQCVNHLSTLSEMSRQYVPSILKEDKTISRLINELYSKNQILSGIQNPKKTSGLLKELLTLFEELFQSPLTEEVLIELTSVNKKEEALDKILEILDIIQQTYKAVNKKQGKINYITEFEQSLEINLFSQNSFTSLALTLKEGIGDVPVINFQSARKTAIPVYKIKSAIADDVNYIQRYKQGNAARKLINAFVAFPQLLSNVNEMIGNGTFEYNELYPGATGIKLETIVPSGSNPNSKGSAIEALKNAFLGDFLGLTLQSHTMAVQPLPYSDKSTAFTKNLNLDAVITIRGKKTTLLKASNEELTLLYFDFERAKRIDIVRKVLTDWKTLFDLDIYIPTLEDIELNPAAFEQLVLAWKYVDKYLTDNQIAENDDLRERIAIKQRRGAFEIVEDLHYRLYSDTVYLSLNNTLLTQLNRVKNLDTFKQFQTTRTWGFMNIDVVGLIFEILKDTKYQHLWDNDLFKDFTEEELCYRYIILTNFVKDQYLDLNFKGVYLDKIKKFSKPDLENPSEEVNALEESLNLKAGSKRTVAMGGTGSFYQLDRVDGVSTIIRSAIFKEPKEQAFSPFGKSTNVEIFNGAGFTSPIFERQQTASLPGDGFNGLNRKTLGMAVDDYRSTLYKWAEYPMTNWHMRMSGGSKFRMEYVFRLMHDISWDKDLDIDLTKNLFGSLLSPDQANAGRSVYFAKGPSHYHLTSMQKIGRNIYKINLTAVNEYGEALVDNIIPKSLYGDMVVTDPELNPNGDNTIVKIESLYDLWRVFGGAESEILTKNARLQASEASLDMLYYYVTNVGTIKNKDGELIQSNVDQPLRNYYVSIAASDSGVKRAVGNRNSNNIWYTEAKTKSGVTLLTTEIQANDISKSLDASHELEDDDDIKEQTQTMSTIAALGTEMLKVEEVYNAINLIILDGIKELNKQLSTLQRGRVEDAIRQMSQEIVETIRRDKDINALTPIIDIIEKGLGGILPPSSPLFFRSMVKRVIQDLNSQSLIRRYQGSADVLNPTSNIIQIYTLNGINKTRDALIRDARRMFEGNSLVKDLTTDEIIKLYIYAQGYDYKENIKGLDFIASLGIDVAATKLDDETGEEVKVTSVSQLLEGMSYLSLQSLLSELSFLPTNTNSLVTSNDHPELGSYKVATQQVFDFTSISPLTPIYYRTVDHKDGESIRTTLNTIEDYTDFIWAVKSGKVTEVYLDLLTPHDLKMQSVSYKTTEGKVENMAASQPSLCLHLFTKMCAETNRRKKEEAKAKETSENNKKNCL